MKNEKREGEKQTKQYRIRLGWFEDTGKMYSNLYEWNPKTKDYENNLSGEDKIYAYTDYGNDDDYQYLDRNIEYWDGSPYLEAVWASHVRHIRDEAERAGIILTDDNCRIEWEVESYTFSELSESNLWKKVEKLKKEIRKN